MAQADIINIKKHGGRHPDSTLLTFLAAWKTARLRARLHWAESEKKSLFCTEGDDIPTAPTEDLEIIDRAESHLAAWEPKTTLGAQLMLEAVAEIISSAQLEPDAALSSGPVLEMIVSVSRSLSCKDIQLKP